jgi:hypothetical protein
MKETREKVLERINAVLTDEQKQKYESYRKKLEEHRSKRPNEKPQKT